MSVDGEQYTWMLDPEEYPSRSDVESFANEMYVELRKPGDTVPSGPMPVSELVERFLDTEVPDRAPSTRRTYRSSLKAITTYFVLEVGDPRTDEVTPNEVRDFLAWRANHDPDGTCRERRLSDRSIAKDRAILHALLGFGASLGVVRGNPVHVVKPPKGDARKPIILTETQYERLLGACEGHDMLAVFLLVLGEAGLRCESEALWLRWSDIDLDRGFLSIRGTGGRADGRGGGTRAVPITARLRQALETHADRYRVRTYGKEGEPSPWVFHHPASRRTAVAGDRIKSLRGAFANTVERAGLPPELNQQDLRHRRATTWLAAGKNPVLVQKALGHSDLQTTMRYTQLVSEDLSALVEGPTERELSALAEI